MVLFKSGKNRVKDKKVTTTVYILQSQHEALKALHKVTKVPVAEFIREGIDMVLKKHEDKLPGQKRLL
jgi:hypothetical protein